jgi:hypothetical protein
VSLTPNNDRAKLVLALALDSANVTRGTKVKGEGQRFELQVGASAGYEMRDWFLRHLYPTAMSFVWDSCSRDVMTVWSSKDQQYPAATRGWLALQGARGVAMFMRRGIGFPVATARPKLANHTMTLNWDRDIGPVAFVIPKLDAGRWVPWKSLVEQAEGWKPGTIYLSEREGKVFATVSYERPIAAENVDPARKLRLHFGETQDQFLRLEGPDGPGTYDVISAQSAVAYMLRALKRRQKLEERRGSCGSPRQPWGQRQANQVETEMLARQTADRSKRAADWNHAWTRRVITRAVEWRCGTLEVDQQPADLFGQPWQWQAFEKDLEYKAVAVGIVIRAGGN